MIKYKYLLGLLILSLGACQSGHKMGRDMDHKMGDKRMDQKTGHNMKHMMKRKRNHMMDQNSNLPVTTEEIKEYNKEFSVVDKKAFEKGDYATAFNFAIEDNQKTKGFTLNAIGTMYHFGYGVEVDYKRAKDLYERALEYGNGEAANHLGRLYLNGEGVEKNENRAREYYKLSCDNNCDAGCENYKIFTN